VSGTLSPDVALVRLLVCLGAVWVGFSVVAQLANRTVQANDMAEAALAKAAADVEKAAARAAAEAAAADAQDEAGEGVGVG